VTNRTAEDPSFRDLLEHSASYEEFRIALAIDRRVSPGAELIYKKWYEDMTARSSLVDVNQLMHSIEKMMAKQMEIDKQILAVEKGYLDVMNIVDGLTGELKTIMMQSSELRELLQRYRQSIASSC
jgi:prophage DNA circulation protein